MYLSLLEKIIFRAKNGIREDLFKTLFPRINYLALVDTNRASLIN